MTYSPHIQLLPCRWCSSRNFIPAHAAGGSWIIRKIYRYDWRIIKWFNSQSKCTDWSIDSECLFTQVDALVCQQAMVGRGNDCLLMFLLQHGDHGEEHSENTIFNLPLTELLVCTGFFLIFFAEEVVHLLLTNHNGLLKSLHDTCDEKKHNNYIPSRHNHSTPYSKYGSTSSGSLKIDDSEIAHLLNETNDVKTHDSSVDSMPIFRCIMIVFALSFHSIFDGVAIGLQSTPGHLIQLMLAIAMHKLLIAFVVGLQIFSETKSLKKVTMYMLPFSLMSPVALVVTAQAKIVFSDLMTGALTAISTGSLLYITFYEILLREKQSARISGLMQFVATVCGFALMALLQSFTEHHHWAKHFISFRVYIYFCFQFAFTVKCMWIDQHSKKRRARV